MNADQAIDALSVNQTGGSIVLTREEFANATEGACPFHGIPLVDQVCPRGGLRVIRVTERGLLAQWGPYPETFFLAPKAADPR